MMKHFIFKGLVMTPIKLVTQSEYAKEKENQWIKMFTTGVVRIGGGNG